MATARVFRSGNSQAVRLPKEYRLKGPEVEIFRRGDEIVLREKAEGLVRAFEILADLAGLLPVLELPSRAGEFYGSIRAALAARGDMIGNNDLWIAAHAKAAGLILVTNNEREFRRIDGLEIQNWAD